MTNSIYLILTDSAKKCVIWEDNRIKVEWSLNFFEEERVQEKNTRKKEGEKKRKHNPFLTFVCCRTVAGS